MVFCWLPKTRFFVKVLLLGKRSNYPRHPWNLRRWSKQLYQGRCFLKVDIALLILNGRWSFELVRWKFVISENLRPMTIKKGFYYIHFLLYDPLCVDITPEAAKLRMHFTKVFRVLFWMKMFCDSSTERIPISRLEIFWGSNYHMWCIY